jgi:hypothetical protein
MNGHTIATVGLAVHVIASGTAVAAPITTPTEQSQTNGDHEAGSQTTGEDG